MLEDAAFSRGKASIVISHIRLASHIHLYNTLLGLALQQVRDLTLSLSPHQYKSTLTDGLRPHCWSHHRHPRFRNLNGICTPFLPAVLC